MDWARILAYVTGTVDQELLERNEYLAAENRILKAQVKGRLKLSDAERGALGEIDHTPRQNESGQKCDDRQALGEANDELRLSHVVVSMALFHHVLPGSGDKELVRYDVLCR